MASIAGRSHAKSIVDYPASTSLPMIHMQAPPHTSKWRYQLLTRWIRRGDYVETVWRLCGNAGSPISRARLPIGAGRFLAAWRCSTPPPAAQVVDVRVGREEQGQGRPSLLRPHDPAHPDRRRPCRHNLTLIPPPLPRESQARSPALVPGGVLPGVSKRLTGGFGSTSGTKNPPAR